MGMVSECCCKEVYNNNYYRYPHNNYYFPATPLVLTLFFGSIIPISLFIFKWFFCTCLCYFCNVIYI